MYKSFFKDLFSKIELRRDFALKNGFLDDIAKPMLQERTNNLNITYDRQLYLDFKDFLQDPETILKYKKQPWNYTSCLKELKSLFLSSEYKVLRSLLNIDYRLVLDEDSEKMEKLRLLSKHQQNDRKEEVLNFLRIFSKGVKTEIMGLMKNLGYDKKGEKEDDFRPFYNAQTETFEEYISEIFQDFFSELHKFKYEENKELIVNTIGVLRKFKLIKEKTKLKYFNNKIKYEKEYEKSIAKIKEGGEIFTSQFQKLDIEINKPYKTETKKNFIDLLDILKGFDFQKYGVESPNFIFFGSFKSGFALNGSDIDTTILTNSAFDERNLLRPLYEYLSDYKSQKPLKNIDLENRVKDNIRIPIIKFFMKYRENDIDKIFKADIAVNNVLGVANSSLLKIYSKIDKRCKKMGLILKHWAKKWKITSEESLSSYALIIMLIYFLQLKRILPSLQKIAKKKRLLQTKNSNEEEKPVIIIKRTVKDQKIEEFETNIEFETDIAEIRKYMETEGFPKNNQNIFELFLEFFYFYSDKGAFRKYYMKCNIKKGEVYFKNVLTEYYDTWEKGFLFSIKDPFDKRHNPGDRVKKQEKIHELRYKIDATIQSLENEDFRENLFKEFFNGVKDNRVMHTS